jgi:hypothetical protein
LACATHEGSRRLVFGDRLEQWGVVLPQRWDVCPSCVVRLTSGGGMALVGSTRSARPVLAPEGSRVILRLPGEDVDVTSDFAGRRYYE